MARTAQNTQPEEHIVTVEQAPLVVQAEALNALALADQQQAARVRAVAERVGYSLPGGYIDPDLIQRDIAANMRRSVEACLEVGRGLATLKEACSHGEFLPRLEVLGVDRVVAWKFIQTAEKFSNVSSTKHLTDAIGNQTKLFEMLVLDDEQIEELELTGQTGELKLDDIATMSVKELRAALREARQDDEAKSRLLADKNAKIDDLTAKPRKSLAEPWPEEVAGLKDDVHGLGLIMDEALGKLLTVLDATEVVMDAAEPDSDKATAYKSVVHHLNEHIERVATLVAGLRFHYETRLHTYIEMDLTNVLTDVLTDSED